MAGARTGGARILGAVFVLSALGIVAFWVNWFASGDFLSAGDTCHRVFENTFPLPDSVLALLLVAAAAQLARGRASALRLAWFASGMMLCLASLDTLWHVQRGGFADPSDPEWPQRVFISTHMYALGAVAAVYFWRARTRHGVSDMLAGPARARACASSIYALYGGGVITFWLFFPNALPVEEPCQEEFLRAFWFADVLSAFAALAACAGLWRKRAFGLLAAEITSGAWAFTTLNWALYYFLNRHQFGMVQPGFIGGLLASLVLALAASALAWRGGSGATPASQSDAT